MKLIILLSVLTTLASCIQPDDVGEVSQALQHWGQYRMVYENRAGSASTMVPVNCPNNPNDPGHWNCVSGLTNASDVPWHMPLTDTFTPELCINKATGGSESFELAEIAPAHAPATVTRVIPEGTVWIWGMTPGQSDALQMCVTRLGTAQCYAWNFNYNSQQAGIFPILFTSDTSFTRDPSTRQPWTNGVAFGDVTLPNDIKLSLFINHPITYNLCIGAAWLEIQYDTP